MSDTQKLLIEPAGTDDLPAAAATYKDRIFRMVFKQKKGMTCHSCCMTG